jgi:Domain of unknown function (DUF6542)
VSELRARLGQSPVSAPGEAVSVLWDGHTRGSEVAALAAALTLTVATIEVSLVGHLRLFFDLCFVVICLVSALMVRPRDFFTVGVLPPLLMFATMVLVALNGPDVIADRHDSIVQAIITGLAHHSVALFAGYAVCLLTLLARQRLPRA